MLSLEPLLRARLADIPGIKGVYGMADLAAEKPYPAPCVYLAYNGARIVDSPEPYDKVKLATRWLVVLSIKNMARAADGKAVRADAQPFVAAVLKCLMGWRPDQAHQSLKLVDAPAPEYQSGLLWLPLMFETIQIFKGE